MTAMLTSDYVAPQATATAPRLRLNVDFEPQQEHNALLETQPASRFEVASTLDEVLSAWCLVYQVYTRSGFITPHDYGFHTSSPAIGEQAAVVRHMQGDRLIATLTAMRDAGHGLPLDELYHDELEDLRAQGRVLTEAGMLADCGDADATSMESIFALMSYAVAYSFVGTGTDLIIGVHPRHGRFYQRAYGFEQIGELRSYAAVNNRPCVLMRLRIETAQTRRFMPRGLAAWREQALDASDFADRYRFRVAGQQTTFFDYYLADKRQAACTSADELQSVRYTFPAPDTAPVMRGLAMG